MNRLILSLLILLSGAGWATAGLAANAPPTAPAIIIPYLSGGIGADEQQMLRERREEFNLRLCFAAKGSGEYLANVKVNIAKLAGGQVLQVDAAGPWLYARLPPGKYRVTAESGGQQLTRTVTLVDARATVVYLYWP